MANIPHTSPLQRREASQPDEASQMQDRHTKFSCTIVHETGSGSLMSALAPFGPGDVACGALEYSSPPAVSGTSSEPVATGFSLTEAIATTEGGFAAMAGFFSLPATSADWCCCWLLMIHSLS
uniref:Uncharacterized protein n=1 Tax=Anopheles merus TaxID=30066 RepID=A0A182V6F9_ANOME